jgi:acetylornithine deacetylase/succinyl-diaminopimelate desuccinylase-like protein
MTAWLGAARTLVTLKSQWKGTLMFIGQPAEETVSGAKAMLEDGLFKRFGKPDYAFALHSWPLAYGTIGYNSGAVSSNSDAIEITFKGRGGHGSAPDKALDPIAIAARFVVDVQTVISREKDPKEFGVVTIGAINGGTVGNIIPDTVKCAAPSALQPGGARENPGRRAPHRQRLRRHGRRAGAGRRPDPGRHRHRQQRRAGDAHRRRAEASFGDANVRACRP